MKRPELIRLWVLLAVVLTGTAAGVGWLVLRSRPSSRNVVLISIDTCRADRLSCYGFPRRTTPNIDAIAEEAMLFENAVSPVPLTLPAHCSMLTGTYPLYHGVHDNLKYHLDKTNITIAEILQGYGYTTAAFVSSFVLDNRFGLGQGFNSYNDHFDKPTAAEEDKERRGGEVSRLACRFLEEHRDESFFLFLHYFDPHTDYNPPEPFASEYADDLYAGEIAYCDRCIGQVIDKLKSLGLYNSSLLIIVGDHGESLGEHGETEHDYYIYQGNVRVPFIIRPPGMRRSKRIDGAVSIVDVVPTILGCLDIPIPGHIQGEDLSRYSKRTAPSEPERYVYCEALTATKYACNPLLGLVSRRWKYIETTRPELYDLYQDPVEKNNLAAKETKQARFMQGQLWDLTAKLISNKAINGKMELDEQSRRRLESLGYVGYGTVDTAFKLDPNKPDPKDFIQYHEYYQKITYLTNHGQYDQAQAICKKVLAEWPDMPDTYLLLGRITFQSGQWAESIAHNTKYLDMVIRQGAQHPRSLVFNPNQSLLAAYGFLGGAYFELGQYDKAVEQCSAALQIKYNQPEVHSNLAAALYRKGQLDEAAKHYNEAIRIDPNYAEAHYKLGVVFAQQGKFDEAVAQFKKTLELRPDYPGASENLTKAQSLREKAKGI
jgi:arylsulfatase A-like enzyme